MSSLSFIIPAYNEEAFIKDTLDSISESVSGLDIPYEIIVVDNNSSDRTSEIAKKWGAKVVFEPFQQIARARNSGAAQASHELLVFMDADTHLSSELIKESLSVINDASTMAGGSTIKLDTSTPITRILLKSWNTVSTQLKFAAGCYLFCRKKDFIEVGGFNEKIYASEEIWLYKNFKKLGRKTNRKVKIITKFPIETSARKFKWFSAFTLWAQVILIFFFPFLCRYKAFCFLWYKRPSAN